MVQLAVTAKQPYIVRSSFTVNTTTGPRMIEAGTVLSLDARKAVPLLLKDLVEPQNEGVRKFNSEFMAGEILVDIITATGRKITLAGTEEAAAKAEPGRATFLPDEVVALWGMPHDFLDRVIDAKEVFPGSMVAPGSRPTERTD